MRFVLETLWNRPGGLFTPAEWRELARAAQAEPEIVASVKARYPNLDRPAQIEEMVAELYRLWAEQRDGYDGVAKALEKAEAFLRALANLLRGKAFVSAALTMEQIASGKVGRRGPQGPGKGRGKFSGLVGFRNWQDAPSIVSTAIRSATTDRITTSGPSLLALVPGRPLFAEMGKSMLSARRYLRAKEEMEAIRNDWHAKAADVAQKWINMQKKDPSAHDAMMDLMHRTTLTGVDPSKPDAWGSNDTLLKSARNEYSRLGAKAPVWARQKLADYEKRKQTYAMLKQLFDALLSFAPEIGQ